MPNPDGPIKLYRLRLSITVMVVGTLVGTGIAIHALAQPNGLGSAEARTVGIGVCVATMILLAICGLGWLSTSASVRTETERIVLTRRWSAVRAISRDGIASARRSRGGEIALLAADETERGTLPDSFNFHPADWLALEQAIPALASLPRSRWGSARRRDPIIAVALGVGMAAAYLAWVVLATRLGFSV